MRQIAAAILVVAACASKPDRAELAASWKKAVAAKDGKALFALADGATQGKLRAVADKTRAVAQKDADVSALVTTFGADAKAPTDELAGAMLAASADAIADDGKTPSVHLEDGRWRVTLAPYGFVTADGAAIDLHARLASDAPPAAAVANKSYNVHIDFNGLTEAEIRKRHHDAFAAIAKDAQFSPGWLADADRLVGFYVGKIGTDNVSTGVGFDVASDGSITTSLMSFDRDQLREVAHPTSWHYGSP